MLALNNLDPMSEVELPPSWGELDDACLASVLGALGDARTLASASMASKRLRDICSADHLWSSAFAADFPFHYDQQLQREGGGAAPSNWRAHYAERRGRERTWQAGHCRSLAVREGHSGPVFAARFLGPPFEGRLALAGGVSGQHETAELSLLDLDRLYPYLGLPASQQLLGGGRGGMPNLCGVFDVRQRPGTAQVLVSGFSNEVNVGSLVQREHPEGPSSGAAGCSEPCYELCHTHTLVGHLAASPAVAVTPGGLAVSASFDGTLRLWQLPQPEDGEPAAGNSDEASSSGQAEPGTVASLRVLRDPSSALQPAAVHSNAVCGVALSSDGARLCSGGNDLQVKAWDVERGMLLLRLVGHEGWVWHVEALDDSHGEILSAGTDSSVRIWDTRSGRQAQRVNLCTEPLYPIAGCCLRPPDQRYIICGAFDANLHVVDRRMMRVLYALEGHGDRVTRVACDGDTVLSASFDSSVFLWNFA